MPRHSTLYSDSGHHHSTDHPLNVIHSSCTEIGLIIWHCIALCSNGTIFISLFITAISIPLFLPHEWMRMHEKHALLFIHFSLPVIMYAIVVHTPVPIQTHTCTSVHLGDTHAESASNRLKWFIATPSITLISYSQVAFFCCCFVVFMCVACSNLLFSFTRYY